MGQHFGLNLVGWFLCWACLGSFSKLAPATWPHLHAWLLLLAVGCGHLLVDSQHPESNLRSPLIIVSGHKRWSENCKVLEVKAWNSYLTASLLPLSMGQNQSPGPLRTKAVERALYLLIGETVTSYWKDTSVKGGEKPVPICCRLPHSPKLYF